MEVDQHGKEEGDMEVDQHGKKEGDMEDDHHGKEKGQNPDSLHFTSTQHHSPAFNLDEERPHCGMRIPYPESRRETT